MIMMMIMVIIIIIIIIIIIMNFSAIDVLVLDSTGTFIKGTERLSWEIALHVSYFVSTESQRRYIP